MQEERVALITNVHQEMGLQIAKDLASEDFTVLLGSRDLTGAERAANAIAGDVRGLQLDVTDLASIAAAAVRIRRELGRLDVLVNNAALSPTGTASADELRTAFETNVFGVLAVTKVMLPLLRAAPDARVVSVPSVADADARSVLDALYPDFQGALDAATLAVISELQASGIAVHVGAETLQLEPATRTIERGSARAPGLEGPATKYLEKYE
jgi:NAD(P)-dependent dehydrogenase (short-subunit alcohol dehydrogenase family)